MRKLFNSWPLKNTSLFILGLVVFVYLLEEPVVAQLIQDIGNLSYIGSFIVGGLFTSTFTAAPAGIILFDLAETLNPFWIAITAGAGAMLGDYIIFRFFKDRVFEELEPIFSEVGGKYVRPLFKTPAFAWMMPVIGAVIIASPLPDEIGVSMLGLSKLKPWQFMLVAFALNSIGILLIVLFART